MNWADRQLPVRGYVSGPAKIRIVENGPARVALEVERTTENSTFVQQIRLAAGTAGDRVEVVNQIEWRTPGVSLRADFPSRRQQSGSELRRQGGRHPARQQ